MYRSLAYGDHYYHRVELQHDGLHYGHHHGGGGCVADPHGQKHRGHHKAHHEASRTLTCTNNEEEVNKETTQS